MDSGGLRAGHCRGNAAAGDACARGSALRGLRAEFGAKTWAQFFLKFNLSHPAVTAVIPGTDKPEYMLDNLQAGRGRMPDAQLRKRMIEYWESVG